MLTVLYFARLRDDVGTGQERIEWQEGFDSLIDIKTLLRDRGEQWKKAFDRNVLHSVNQQIAQEDHAIHDGDEIAFFPPVTGG